MRDCGLETFLLSEGTLLGLGDYSVKASLDIVVIDFLQAGFGGFLSTLYPLNNLFQVRIFCLQGQL